MSQAPSSPDPLEVSIMAFCLGTCGAGRARTGAESRPEFSPVFVRIQTLLVEQSLASPRTVPAADAWSFLAVGHLRGKHTHPIPTLVWECSCRSWSQYLPACPVRGQGFEGLKVEGEYVSWWWFRGEPLPHNIPSCFPDRASIWTSSWSHTGPSAQPFALPPKAVALQQ